MDLEAIKTWQWMLTGLFIGLLFSCIVAWSGPTYDAQPRDTIEQGEFENSALALAENSANNRILGEDFGELRPAIQFYHKGQPLLKDLTVHPPMPGDPQKRYWVTGREFAAYARAVDPSKPNGAKKEWGEWRPFKYGAAIPYEPGYTVAEEKHQRERTANQTADLVALKKELGGASSFPTVIEYLTAVSKLPGNSSFEFNKWGNFAWWELNGPKWTLPPLAGFLMIGCAWPLLLGILRNFGLVKPEPKKVGAVARKPVQTAREPVPVRHTDAVVTAPKPPPKPAAAPMNYSDYRGEFYPVVKPHHEAGGEKKDTPKDAKAPVK